ncbi:hypothetical protein A3D72_00735 [Candidatus Uhrbacteria bacterium RIFCSPHIGHO2_02_FULL_57_19]|uniref:Uncharacterized protein n=1 Tax=Candidatus Uhrbacteria bacterium RIFCSPHIGHO2_02_FULL_57_19 TaxID=1802391 RepID=A0A1F7U566_9BACT|nr:MAG: hypothetical protein A3D72_00735 [Candidatus Uhrbacteria bacterium RIFCSPHIGHO2_02_FULL_57_19]
MEPEKPQGDLGIAVRSFKAQLAELAAMRESQKKDLVAKEEAYKKLGEEIDLAKLEIEELEKTESDLLRQIEQTEALQARLDGILRPKS